MNALPHAEKSIRLFKPLIENQIERGNLFIQFKQRHIIISLDLWHIMSVNRKKQRNYLNLLTLYFNFKLTEDYYAEQHKLHGENIDRFSDTNSEPIAFSVVTIDGDVVVRDFVQNYTD